MLTGGRAGGVGAEGPGEKCLRLSWKRHNQLGAPLAPLALLPETRDPSRIRPETRDAHRVERGRCGNVCCGRLIARGA